MYSPEILLSLLQEEEIKKKLTMDDSMFKWIGYMGNYKGSFDFKIINTELAKLTSSVFENKGRAEMYKILNETSESVVYNTTTADVKKIQLGMIEELYLRSFDKMDGMRYFLNKLEIYVVNKIRIFDGRSSDSSREIENI